MAKRVIERTKQAVFRRWIEALESGRYKQAQGYLRTPEGFCCLGVLCDLARRDGGANWVAYDETSLEDAYYEYKDYGSSLPIEILEFMGMSTSDQTQLMLMNDNGARFEDIAKVLRLYFRGMPMDQAISAVDRLLRKRGL